MSKRTILFSVFVILLAGLHLYIGMRLLPAIALPVAWHWAAFAWLAVSTVMMPVGMLARTYKNQPWADWAAWLGLVIMGLFSSLLVLTFLRDIVLFVAWIVQGSGGQGEGLRHLTSTTALMVPVIAVAVTLWGFKNARKLAHIKHVDVPLTNLPPSLHGFTIAQISDIHIGPTIKRGYLDAIVDAVNELDADMVAVTGDLVDGSVQELAAHTRPLGRLSSRHGTFFVTGNHEYYSGAHAWIKELRDLGLKVLLNEHVIVNHSGAQVLIAGVTDYTAHHFDPSHRSDAMAAMAGAPADTAVKVLLAHQPRSATKASEAGFDLQISGHTHGGQFFPWNLFVRFQQPFTSGLNKLNDLWVYTSRGTGYWGPPKRFGAPSEITLLHFVAKTVSH